MTFLNSDEYSATRSTNLVVRDQLTCDGRAIVSRINYPRDQFYWTIRGRWAQEFDCVFGSDRARRFISAGFVHQMPGRGPVAVTIEQRADDAATEHSLESFVLLTRLPFRDDLFAVGKAADVQAFRICWSTTEAGKVGSVSFLNAFHFLNDCRNLKRCTFPVAV